MHSASRWLAGCLVGLILACSAHAVVREGNGASIQFPGPDSSVSREADDSVGAERWQQLSPTPTDPDRVLVFIATKPSWWFKLIMLMGPEAMLLGAEERMLESMLKPYEKVGGAEYDVELVHVNGHAALDVTFERNDMSQTALRPDGKPSTLANREYSRNLVLWTGEALVFASVGGNQPVAKTDPFLRSLTTKVRGTPGDPEKQFDFWCNVGGILLMLFLLGLIVMIYFIDKTIKRRRKARAALAVT